MKDLRKPTDGERLWLSRRRKGLAQDVAARAVGLGERTYAAAEADRKPFPGRLPALGRLTLPEKLALARRRDGSGLAVVARMLRVTRVTLLAMERRGDLSLRHFWERCGFRF